ncbi:MAG: WYL domain-containing protein [Saprospiraceae bacterium]|nr:WYL domain-containing protein [Saprospiraceae bacterium]
MSVNKLALIRYKIIDECLRNRMRKWTLEDLIDKVSEELYEYEGIRSISKRSIQADIQLMRSEKLGYRAPIIVKDKKYYTYANKDYSITKINSNPQKTEKLKEIIGFLKQFQGFSYFDEMGEMISKLENYLYKSTDQKKNFIQFETNKLLKGIQFIYPLYQAILHQSAILCEYQSFKAEEATQKIYYPYLLKEYHNRWFLIARQKKSPYMLTLALDRMLGFQELPYEPYIEYEGIDFNTYFGEVIGVTKSERDRPRKVTLQIDKQNEPYVLTKPIHQSQQILRQDDTGIIIRLDVVINFELEREILGFGQSIKVLSPRDLQHRIRKRLVKAAGLYEG